MPVARRLSYAAAALVAAAAVIYVFSQRRPTSHGSTTNASDARSAPLLAADATAEEILDAAVEYTFPASDPISIEHAYETALSKANGKENGRPQAAVS